MTPRASSLFGLARAISKLPTGLRVSLTVAKYSCLKILFVSPVTSSAFEKQSSPRYRNLLVSACSEPIALAEIPTRPNWTKLETMGIRDFRLKSEITKVC